MEIKEGDLVEVIKGDSFVAGIGSYGRVVNVFPNGDVAVRLIKAVYSDNQSKTFPPNKGPVVLTSREIWKLKSNDKGFKRWF